jgi:EAL domain-containing protein (putative c-di-GMP-specific phosphodiesterase class I)
MTNSLVAGLPIGNRAQFLAFVASRLNALPSPFPAIAIISVVLPGLAAFRQTYGEVAANYLLHRAYMAVRHFVPDTLIGRLADGQFALSYEFDPEWASIHDIASDLRAAIAGAKGGQDLALAASPCLGAIVHSGHPARGMSLELSTELLHQANLAAHIACGPSQNGFVLYSHAEDVRIRSGTILDQSLRQAIARREFRLHYQPVVDLRTLEMVGMEGLVRWKHPISGLRGPGDFIPEAERSGLIVEIGAAVIEIGIQQIADWLTSGWNPPRVALNVSAAQLQDPGFRSTLLRSVVGGQVAATNLELELTERTLITQSSETRRLLDELREMGISITLDDFGTGYSSLQYLRDLPISKLKIDGAFIRHIATDRRDARLVRTIVELGDALGIAIVAECVEHESQAVALLECGCTTGQGYLYSKPQPADILPRLQSSLRKRHYVAPASCCLVGAAN